MEKSIRDIITGYSNEIINGDLSPVRASEILANLSALYGNVLDCIKDADVAYNKILLKYYEEEKTANRARIKAEITKEFSDKQNAKNTEKIMLEMARNLKWFLRAKGNEYKLGGNF